MVYNLYITVYNIFAIVKGKEKKLEKEHIDK